MPSWNFIGSGVGTDTSNGAFSVGTPTGTHADGDLFVCMLNARNGEIPTLPTGGTNWTYIGSTPTASNATVGGTGALSQEFWYYCIRSGGTNPSLSVTRGTGPNICQYNIHVWRPQAGYRIELVNSSFESDASAVAATHTHASITTSHADTLILHWIGYGASNGADSFTAATDPTDVSSGSTATTGVIAAQEWERRGNLGSGSGMNSGVSCAITIKSSAGATGQLSCAISAGATRRVASGVVWFRQVQNVYTIAADTAAAAISTTAATLLKNSRIAADTIAYAISEQAATLARKLTIAADTIAVNIVPTDAALRRNYAVQADTVAVAITPTAANLARTHRLIADTVAVDITPTAATLARTYRIAADTIAVSITPTDAGLLKKLRIAADTVAVDITPTDAGLRKNSRIDAQAGSVLITPTAANLTYTPVGSYSISADAGSVVITTTAANLLKNWRLPADTTAFVISPTPATLTYTALVHRSLVCDAASYAITATAAVLTYLPIIVPPVAAPGGGGGAPTSSWRRRRKGKRPLYPHEWEALERAELEAQRHHAIAEARKYGSIPPGLTPAEGLALLDRITEADLDLRGRTAYQPAPIDKTNAGPLIIRQQREEAEAAAAASAARRAEMDGRRRAAVIEARRQKEIDDDDDDVLALLL